jgi:hypothetical protein
MAKTGDQSRALALSSGLGRTALVLDDNDVVDLLRIAIEREGGHNRILTGRRTVGAAIAELVGLRKACRSASQRRIAYVVK